MIVIYFDIYASRTGSNIKVGIHNAGGVTTEITPNITSSDVWQAVTWDISAVADADKNAIDQIVITVVNADAANVFYIDNFYGSSSAAVNLYDNIDITDYINGLIPILQISVDDSVDVSDEVMAEIAAAGELNATAYDEIGLTDDVSVSIPILLISVFDSIDVSDEIAVNIPILYAAVFDSPAVSDEVTASQIATWQAEAYDSITVADVAEASLNLYGVLVAESIGLTDTTDVSIPILLVSAFDSISISDDVTVALSLYEISVSDSIGLADITNVSIPILLISVYNSIVITENVVSALTLYEVAVYDSVVVDDEVLTSLIATWQVEASDDISLTDETQAALNLYESLVSDTIGLSDEVTTELNLYETSLFDNADIGDYAEVEEIGIGIHSVNVYDNLDLIDETVLSKVSIKIYTKGVEIILPSDDTKPEIEFSENEYEYTKDDDNNRISQEGFGGYCLYLFKDKALAQSPIIFHWNGQSNVAPSISAVNLQIFNRLSAGWDTLTFNDSGLADVDFDLDAVISENLEDYYDEELWISSRVYQKVI